MSYDHSSEPTRLVLPNPYTLQNRLMFVAAAVLVAGGVLALWWAREALLGADGSGSALPLAVGILLLVAGLSAAARASARLRFLFGRNRPRALAADFREGSSYTSREADELKDLLRQGAIAYPEPSGAVAGALYHAVPRLITAPVEVQHLAQQHVFNLLALAATLASLGLAWALTPDPSTRAWLSIGYAVFAFVFLLRPVVRQATAKIGLASIVTLVVAALLAPVLLRLAGPRLPDLGAFSLVPQVLLMLIGGLIAVAIAVRAVLAQTDDPPTTRTSAVQTRLTLNAPPSALLDELDRVLQEQWTERIPNRRYVRQEPVIDPARHAAPFAGELLEETQPMPRAGVTAIHFGAALASPRHRWLLLMDLYAVLLVVFAVAAALWVCSHLRLDGDWRRGGWRLLGLSGLSLLLAAYVQSLAARLWGRFDFESTLSWVEFAGTYQSGSIGTGQALSGRLKTHSQVVRVEAMTLRVWRARIESVSFGKDGARRVTAMFSTDAEARQLATQLGEFGQGQSALLAPLATEDARRLASVAQAEQLLASGERSSRQIAAKLDASARLADLGASERAAAPVAPPPRADARHCHHCGAALPAGARYCPACGQAVAA